MNIKIKRVYEPTDKDDGTRILVDRLWPRGLTKAKASVDLWLKEIAPSTELRHNADLTILLKRKARDGLITLVYAARDERHNEALVLKQVLEREQ